MRLLFLAIPALALSVPFTASAQTTSAGPRSATCTSLAGDLDNLGKSLAMNFAEGIGDRRRNGPALREAQYDNLLARVRLTMDLMRDNRCRMPTSVPDGGEYVESALQCRTDMLESPAGAGTPASCDRASWRPKAR